MNRSKLFPSKAARHEAIEGYIFILPWLLGFIIFTAGPMISSIFISLTRWDLLTPARWTGLTNYQNLPDDELVWKSLYNTAYYTLFSVPLQMMVSVVLAVALNAKVRFTRFYRTLYYIPSLVPVVASSILWLWFFHPTYGIANAFLKVIGVSPQKWFFDAQLIKPTFVLISLWGVGSSVIIILAALQGVSQELYEAAEIDGANSWHRFRHITVPLITPAIFFNLILGIINSFQIFTSAFIISNVASGGAEGTLGGGPQNSGLFYFVYLYRNAFSYKKMGYASALAWVLFFIILIFTIIQMKLADRWVYYESGLR